MTSPPWDTAPKNGQQPRRSARRWVGVAAASTLAILLSGCAAASGTAAADHSESAAHQEAPQRGGIID